MPCRSDYMEQSNSERRFQETAQLLLMLRNHLSLRTPQKFYKEAENYYARNVGQVELLCETIREHKDAFELYMQANLRDSSKVRRLADWWEEHQEEDRKRIEAEEAERKHRDLVASAKKKLTPEELSAITGIQV